MMGIKNPGLIIQLLVILINPWWWVIIQRNFWIGLPIFILSLVVFVFFWQIESKKNLLLLVILTTTIFFIATYEAFDESIFRNSALDIQQYNKRHEFYAKGLGKIYTNRFSLTYFKDFNLPFYKLQRNFFAYFDPNLYFFASHPRERLGIEEFGKYLPIFLPFFLLGFFYIICKLLPKLLLYLIIVLLASSVISPSYNLGPVLFFPVVNYLITIGIILSLKRGLRYL